MALYRFSRIALLLGLWCFLSPAVAQVADARKSTVIPQPQTEGWWHDRHKSFNERVAQGHVDLLFIGDSITQAWEFNGKDIWAKRYASRNAVNLGTAGDGTQHVLWRMDHGNVDGIKPKLAVVMIGGNNSNGDDHTAEEIGAGIQAVIKKLRVKLPDTKILLLAIFPRGERPNPQRAKNAKASKIGSELADEKTIFYMDINSKFMDEIGTLQVMPDQIHLNEKGYEIWADAIESKIAELMGEKK